MLRVFAVGDLMLGEHLLYAGHGMAAACRQRGAAFFLAKVKHLLSQGDITFGNMECTVGLEATRRDALLPRQMLADPSWPDALADCGFNVVSVANNHTLDHGEAALARTAELLLRSGIAPVGFPLRASPLLFEKHGVRVGLLAYWLPTRTLAGKEEAICSEIRNARDHNHVVIVSLHWGDEFASNPSPDQIQFAHALVDHGATVILGHHPHVVQRIERYDEAVVAYSLGNFLSDMHHSQTRDSVVLQLEIAGEGRVSSWSVHPIRMGNSQQIEVISNPSVGESAWLKHGLLDCDATGPNRALYKQALARCALGVRRERLRYFLTHLTCYPPLVIPRIVASGWFRRDPYPWPRW